jgi:uncharacterized phage protein (predicted DNA packaging)
MTISDLKRQLNIEADYNDDNTLLQSYLNVSEKAVINYLNLYTGSTSGYTMNNAPIEIQQAMLLFAANLYQNRTIISYGNLVKIPYTFEFLLNDYRNKTVA